MRHTHTLSAQTGPWCDVPDICAGQTTTALTWKTVLINVDGAEARAGDGHTSSVREGLGTLLTPQSTLAQLVWS